jgi:hypothetical protein
MKTQSYRFLFPLFFVALLYAPLSYAQSNFQNLNFESANIVLDSTSPYYPNAINASNAMSGWTVTGSFTAPDVLYNDISLASPAVSLQGPGSTEPILQGSYTVFLQGSQFGMPGAVTIGQTGQIPSGTGSLQFYGAQIFNLQLSFNGQNLAYTAIGTGPNYTIYGANVSAFAGQTGQLLFDAPPNSAGEIDNIQFSPNSVPEPQTWTLILSGAAVCLAAARWKRTR